VEGRFAWEGDRRFVEASEFEHLYHRVVEGRV